MRIHIEDLKSNAIDIAASEARLIALDEATALAGEQQLSRKQWRCLMNEIYERELETLSAGYLRELVDKHGEGDIEYD